MVKCARASYTPWMQTRADSLRVEAEKCRSQAKKAGSVTAMFILLDLAADMLERANREEPTPPNAPATRTTTREDALSGGPYRGGPSQ
jgi:hypothetical protein